VLKSWVPDKAIEILQIIVMIPGGRHVLAQQCRQGQLLFNQFFTFLSQILVLGVNFEAKYPGSIWVFGRIC
jgi:hypothetical protein